MIVCTLKQYIDKNDLNISALSKKCGISRPPLIALANGTSKGIQFDTLDKLCRFFKISPSDLLLRFDESDVFADVDLSSVDWDRPSRLVCSGSITVGRFMMDTEVLLSVETDGFDAEIRLSRTSLDDEKIEFFLEVVDEHQEISNSIRTAVEKFIGNQILDSCPLDDVNYSVQLVL